VVDRQRTTAGCPPSVFGSWRTNAVIEDNDAGIGHAFAPQIGVIVRDVKVTVRSPSIMLLRIRKRLAQELDTFDKGK